MPDKKVSVNQPHICIIILNWNGYQVTRECLLSLRSIIYRNYKIILIDNGSQDHSVEKLSGEFQGVDFLAFDKNHGFAGGNNKGITFALGKYLPDFILLLNNDTEVENDFLDKLLAGFDNNDNALVAVPKICYFDKKDNIWSAGGKVSKLTGIVDEFGKNKKDSGFVSKEGPTGFMNGCAALLSTKAFETVGFFDERFFAYSEDTDYSLRILKSGHSIVYVPDARVYHKVSHSFSGKNGTSAKYYLATRNIILLQQKHLEKSLFPVFVLLFLFRWVLYLTIKQIFMLHFNALPAIWKGFFDGLANRGNRNPHFFE